MIPVLLALLGTLATPAFARSAAAPISMAVCGDGLRSVQELAEFDAFRKELAENDAHRAANRAASEAVSKILIEAFRDSGLGAVEKGVIEDAKALVENPLFDEALARSFSVGGLKKGQTILEFQAQLKLASEANQLAFSELVLKQYGDLLEQAFVWSDEDKFALIGKRWGLSGDQTFDILTRWAASEATNHASIQLAVLAWAKAIDPTAIVNDIRAMKKIPRKMRITDAEDVLFTRIKKPHYDSDLAANIGPISDSAFKWRMRLWNFLGAGKRVLNTVRYPKEASFVIALSVAPVTFIHAIGHDWNLTNTVATIIGGVATCPPLVMQLTKRAEIANHESIFLEILTLKQLSELSRWIEKYPKRANEVGFANLGEGLQARIATLRGLRYVKPEHL